MKYEKIRVGERILCESQGFFYEAKVLEKEETEILVHYQGWHKRYDEWIDKDETPARVKPFSQEEVNETKRKLAEKKAEEKQRKIEAEAAKQRKIEAEAAKQAKANKTTTPVPSSPSPASVVFKDRSPIKRDATIATPSGPLNSSNFVVKPVTITSLHPSDSQSKPIRSVMIATNGDSRKRKFEMVSAQSSSIPMPKGITFVSAKPSMFSRLTAVTKNNTNTPITVHRLSASLQNGKPLNLQGNVKLYTINKPKVSGTSDAKASTAKDSTVQQANVKIINIKNPKDPEPETSKNVTEQPCSCGIAECRIVTPFDEGPLEQSPKKEEPVPEAPKLSLPFHCSICGLAFESKVHLDLHKLFTACKEKKEAEDAVEGKEEGKEGEMEQSSASSVESNLPTQPMKNFPGNSSQEALTQLMNKLKENPTRPIFIRSKKPGVVSNGPSVVTPNVPGRVPILKEAPKGSVSAKMSQMPPQSPVIPPSGRIFCSICKKIFSTLVARSSHMETAHMTWCHTCKRTIPQISYAKHMESIHQGAQNTSKQSAPIRAIFTTRCSQCKRFFNSANSYEMHLRLCKPSPQPATNSTTPAAVNKAQKVPRSAFTCSYCSTSCDDNAMLALHVLMHHQKNVPQPSA